MLHLKVNFPLKMKDITMVAKLLTYPHHLEEPQRFTTSPVKKRASFDPNPVMPHIRGIRELPYRLVHRCLPFSSSEDDDDTPMDETPSPHSTLPAQHHTDTFQQSPSKCTLHMYVTLEAEEEDMEEVSKQYPLMMNIGIWRKSLTELYVFTNMPYHMDYAHTCVTMQTTRHHHTMTHWIFK